MEFTIKFASPEQFQTGLLVLGAFADAPLPPASRAVDEASQGALSRLVSSGELGEKAGSVVLLHGLAGAAAERILLVSFGKTEAFGDKPWREAVTAIGGALAATVAKKAAIALDETELPSGRDFAWALRQASRIVSDSAYRFEPPRGKKKREKKHGAGKVAFLLPAVPIIDETLEEAARQGRAIAEGMALAKDLGNLGANVCTPAYLAEVASDLGKQYKFEVEVLEREEMEKLGMGAFLAVARGARQSPRFIVMRRQGVKPHKLEDGKLRSHPVTLIGKGITFDSGGISLKPGAEMDEMKYDMCGAACVIGAFKTLGVLALPLDVVGIIPATENMPGGNAARPGDVVRSLSGQTIEILNTDAEGRLVLCDALTYAERFKPACVIDIATLTGACIVALGKIPSGLLANDDALAEDLTQCGTDAGDRVWRLPLWEEYQDLLKSNFADMANIGGRFGGAITAAAFLSRFATAYKWAHLDIAGTAWLSGEAKGSTGRPLPLLAEFLIARAAAGKR
ncbi:MAG: leucyl aminopeptidase [Azoarcus sp.]|nr:leucyl aminopeptidase [Azoarcus sp.]